VRRERLVAGLPHAIASTRRYSVHISHVFLVLLALVALFWGFWAFHVIEWNLFSFVSLLAGPGLVYFLACMLIPDVPAQCLVARLLLRRAPAVLHRLGLWGLLRP
jgi:hypothetical protein